jgi:hypothetical protein
MDDFICCSCIRQCHKEHNVEYNQPKCFTCDCGKVGVSCKIPPMQTNRPKIPEKKDEEEDYDSKNSIIFERYLILCFILFFFF